MSTPIYDFVSQYAKDGISRFHMPGHKGKALLGPEAYDITEVFGADTLSVSSGIIGESENLTSKFFDTGHTFYSTEGSTHAIKSMLAIALSGKKNPTVLAARGAHKAFVLAAALLDFNIEWIYPKSKAHIASAVVELDDVTKALDKHPEAVAVYLTSPDYLGNLSDIRGIANEVHKREMLLLVDNAHGAYLKLLSPSMHPIDMGADMCTDSAHKTLPVLTGGAYLHLAKHLPEKIMSSARSKMAIFASTSPSYLTLASLDVMQHRLNSGYKSEVEECIRKTDELKLKLSALGYVPEDTEPCKIVIKAKKYGYTADEIARVLREQRVEPEFADTDYIVLMTSPMLDAIDYQRVIDVFSSIAHREPISEYEMTVPRLDAKMSVREAVFAPSTLVSIDKAVGRICAAPTVSCPPAIPIAVSGELISEESIPAFLRYGINEILVVDD